MMEQMPSLTLREYITCNNYRKSVQTYNRSKQKNRSPRKTYLQVDDGPKIKSQALIQSHVKDINIFVKSITKEDNLFAKFEKMMAELLRVFVRQIQHLRTSSSAMNSFLRFSAARSQIASNSHMHLAVEDHLDVGESKYSSFFDASRIKNSQFHVENSRAGRFQSEFYDQQKKCDQQKEQQIKLDRVLQKLGDSHVLVWPVESEQSSSSSNSIFMPQQQARSKIQKSRIEYFIENLTNEQSQNNTKNSIEASVFKELDSNSNHSSLLSKNESLPVSKVNESNISSEVRRSQYSSKSRQRRRERQRSTIITLPLDSNLPHSSRRVTFDQNNEPFLSPIMKPLTHGVECISEMDNASSILRGSFRKNPRQERQKNRVHDKRYSKQ